MKYLRNKLNRPEFKNAKTLLGALLISAISLSPVNADGLKGFNGGAFHEEETKPVCDFVCTNDAPTKNKAIQTCVFVPKGCNNKADKLGIPKAQLDQLLQPKLLNPQLIIPKKRIIPGDQFKPR